MSYTPHQQLEIATEGQSDWDTVINANDSILERGYHINMPAGLAINSGQICTVSSAGYVLPFDARSLAIRPQCMAYRSVSSGETAQFIVDGAVTSMGVWSGFLKIGQPVFASLSSLGFCVASYAGAGHAVGFALSHDSIRFIPGTSRVLPELTTETQTVGPVLVGSYGDFSMSLANRGIARRLEIISNSGDAWKVRFWSGSSRVASELLYETLTRSVTAGNSVDVNSRYYLDQAMFPWFNTDVASMALVFGRIDAQSGSTVNTATFAVTVQVERFR
jgi:hypothetical protein